MLQPGPAGEVPHNQVRVFEDKRYYYDGHGRLIVKLSGAHRAQYFQWNQEHQLTTIHTIWSEGQNQRGRPRSLEEARQHTLQKAQALKDAKVTRTTFEYDALGRRTRVQVYSGNGQAQHKSSHTEFLWEGMRLLQERQIDLRDGEGKTQRTVTYVYEPGSYVPLARIDSQAQQSDAGELKRFESQEAANSERYGKDSTGNGNGGGRGSGASRGTQVYYFHTDTSGLPQELSDAGGALRWRASYQTWGNTVKEEWTALGLSGAAQVEQDFNETAPQKLEQNLRFQGQYLDRSTGLHYNTFRYYDPDIGRFISPDPIGLAGGDNLYQYAPNPVSWIDPWGWATFGSGKGQHNANVTVTDASGKVIYSKPFQSGNMTPAEKALGFPQSTLATHTEARAVKQVPLSAGQTMTIDGQYPPCKSCQGKMRAAAANSDATIKYNWTEEGVPKSKSWGKGC